MNKAVHNFISKMVTQLESEGGDKEAIKKKYRELIQGKPISMEDLDDPLIDVKDIDLYLEMNRLPDPTPKDIDDIKRYISNDLTEDEIEDLWDRMFSNTKIYDTYEMMKLSHTIKTGKEPQFLPKRV
jgi:hypothetical protein